MSSLDETGLDLLFNHARTHRAFFAEPITDEQLHAIWASARLPPTAVNANPLRVAFVRSPEAKERLRPALDAGNIEKAMSASACAILAYDAAFYDQMPKLFPGRDLRTRLAADPAAALEQAKFNATLQAGYFILAARAHGLDCGPMGGFDKAKVDELFFAGTSWRSLLLLNLGHGDASKLHPRQPRLDFEEACRVL